MNKKETKQNETPQLTHKERLILATKHTNELKTQHLALTELLKEIEDEQETLLKKLNIETEEKDTYRSLIKQAKKITDYLESASRAQIKIAQTGRENGTNDLIQLYPAINEIFTTFYYAHQGNLQIQKNIESIKGTKIFANQTNLQRTILNMLTYSEANTQQGTILLGAEKLENKIKLYVQDTSQGFDIKDQLKKISTTQQEYLQKFNVNDSDLNLIVAQKLTERLNGEFEIQSEIGKGTTTAIYLNSFKDK
ncbi:MAG: ATP-binding protein [Candidatus Woesearchaeota archaeon]